MTQVGRLLLAVEVLSPSTRRTDRTRKLQRYRREGVPWYWIVDPEQRMIEVWQPAASAADVVTGLLELVLPGASPPLTIDLRAVFAAALDR